MATNTVLIVEGKPENRESIRKHFAEQGFETVESDNCAAAEQLWRMRKPDIAVLGSQLSDGTAVNLAARLRATDAAAPIVFLTANSPSDAALEAIQFGTEHSGTKTLREVERHYIEEVLCRLGWRVESAAKKLGIPRSSLYHKIKQYGLSRANGDTAALSASARSVPNQTEVRSSSLQG